jgi:molecular chaperone HtpG
VWSRQIPFRVDIAGVIEIMGASLYSRSDTPVRELIQNAHDAIMRRRNTDLEYQGKIDVQQDTSQRTLTFSDDGVGLNATDAETYLGTLGIGITGLLKGRGTDQQRSQIHGDSNGLIGQFGIGLFSAFLLADRLVVESRRTAEEDAIRWEAGPGTEILLSNSERTTTGTSVTLHLKSEFARLSDNAEQLETVIREYADFLTVPIHLNGASARVNVIKASWFQPTPDPEELELELASYFDESPLEVIPIRQESPVTVAGALFVSPQRTPGFADDATIAVTVRRMVISRRIRDLIPRWAVFIRGVLELQECNPTASREDLVRDDRFQAVQSVIAESIFRHLELLAENHPARLEAIVNWHRYSLAGAALSEPRLRRLLRGVYRWTTSHGPMTIDDILDASPADPLFETEADGVVWYNADRRQERYLDTLFASSTAPCIHTLRSFEETLLAAMIADTAEAAIDMRAASPSSPNFAESILGLSNLEEISDKWNAFFEGTRAVIMTAGFHAAQPVMAFLNERFELSESLQALKRDGEIPPGFQRLIDAHFEQSPSGLNEVVLNRNHRLVSRALEQGPASPLASVLRLLVCQALNSAGASSTDGLSSQLAEDLDWIADSLWGKT